MSKGPGSARAKPVEANKSEDGEFHKWSVPIFDLLFSIFDKWKEGLPAQVDGRGDRAPTTFRIRGGGQGICRP